LSSRPVRSRQLRRLRAAPERRSRRPERTAAGGHLDVRATVRGALRTDGEAPRPAHSGSSRRPRRLLVLCDVSGSMERYSRALLGALEAVVGSGLKAETFGFATRLTRVTGPLHGRDAKRARPGARGGARVVGRDAHRLGARRVQHGLRPPGLCPRRDRDRHLRRLGPRRPVPAGP